MLVSYIILIYNSNIPPAIIPEAELVNMKHTLA